MIQPLITGERGCASLVAFAERVTWLQECTNDPYTLERAFNVLNSRVAAAAFIARWRRV